MRNYMNSKQILFSHGMDPMKDEKPAAAKMGAFPFLNVRVYTRVMLHLPLNGLSSSNKRADKFGSSGRSNRGDAVV